MYNNQLPGTTEVVSRRVIASKHFTSHKDWRGVVNLKLPKPERRTGANQSSITTRTHENDELIDTLKLFHLIWGVPLHRILSVKHSVDLKPPTIRPVRSVPCPAEPRTCDCEKSKIENILAMSVIETAQSERASPVEFISKKYGTLRFCVDYIKRNAVTIYKPYSLPIMDELLESLGQAHLF